MDDLSSFRRELYELVHRHGYQVEVTRTESKLQVVCTKAGELVVPQHERKITWLLQRHEPEKPGDDDMPEPDHVVGE